MGAAQEARGCLLDLVLVVDSWRVGDQIRRRILTSLLTTWWSLVTRDAATQWLATQRRKGCSLTFHGTVPHGRGQAPTTSYYTYELRYGRTERGDTSAPSNAPAAAVDDESCAPGWIDGWIDGWMGFQVVRHLPLLAWCQVADTAFHRCRRAGAPTSPRWPSPVSLRPLSSARAVIIGELLAALHYLGRALLPSLGREFGMKWNWKAIAAAPRRQ